MCKAMNFVLNGAQFSQGHGASVKPGIIYTLINYFWNLCCLQSGSPTNKTMCFVTQQGVSFPAGVEGITACGEILDLSGMSSLPPLQQCEISDC